MGRILNRQAYVALKAATKRSVAFLGGSESVAAFFGMCRQHVERWYRIDDESATRFIPLWRLLELETEVASSGGVPQVISTIADQCGFDLVRRGSGAKATPIQANANLMRAAGEACQIIAEASEDNIFTGDEKAQCKVLLQNVIQQAQAAIVTLEGA